MNSTVIDLGNIGIGSVVKDIDVIVEFDKNNVQRLFCPFAHGRSEKIGWYHAEVLISRKMQRFFKETHEK